MEYAIEALTAENAEAYERVRALAWRQTYPGLVDGAYLELINREEQIRQAAERLARSLGDGSGRAFVLYVEGQPSGILRVRPSKYPQYADCGELGVIYLLDRVKGRGFGRILFARAVEELREMGFSKMINGCFDANPSNGFYRHMGGVYLAQYPLTLPNGQRIMENVYLYAHI